MVPKINRRQTGLRLRKLMDERNLSVRDIQTYLELDSVQSVYRWLNGLSTPTTEHLYALSGLLQVPVDELLCGTRARLMTKEVLAHYKRTAVYYNKFWQIKLA